MLDIIKKPVITEKSLDLANKQNVYTFLVAKGVNKNQIKTAIEELYGVTVLSVNTVMKYRVMRSTGKKRLKVLQGKMKKALVKLKDGESIDVFDTSK